MAMQNKYYDPKKKRVILTPIKVITELKPKIVQIFMTENCTKLRMAPEWFQHDDQNESLKKIVYPEGISVDEQHKFNTVARYRATIGKPENNFRKASINPSETSTEVVIIALDDFTRKFNGELSLTHENVTFNEPAYRTACGIADLSSAHLLANDYIPTAIFSFVINLDYRIDLARSSETMQNFVLHFSNAIAEILTCSSDYVRVISVDKLSKRSNQSKVNFGLTTPRPETTKQLVEDLKVYFCFSYIQPT